MALVLWWAMTSGSRISSCMPLISFTTETTSAAGMFGQNSRFHYGSLRHRVLLPPWYTNSRHPGRDDFASDLFKASATGPHTVHLLGVVRHLLRRLSAT